MSGIIVKRIDPHSNDVVNFRKEVITQDENNDLKYLTDDIKYNPDIPEEVWKFSFRKWNSLNLDALYGVYHNNDLAAISGAKLYGKNKNFIRVGMCYYTLKRFRNIVRSSLWNLMIPAALDDFQNHRNINIDYSFVTIYPHNNKLEIWSKKLIKKESYGQIGNGLNHIALLKSYSMEDKFIKINGVLQRILYRTENKNTITLNDFYKEIEDH